MKPKYTKYVIHGLISVGCFYHGDLRKHGTPACSSLWCYSEH